MEGYGLNEVAELNMSHLPRPQVLGCEERSPATTPHPLAPSARTGVMFGAGEQSPIEWEIAAPPKSRAAARNDMLMRNHKLAPQIMVYNLSLQIGAWRSPASALAWGARGRRFES